MRPDQQDVFFQLIISGGGEFRYDLSGNLREAAVSATTTDPLQGLSCPSGRSFWNGKGAILILISDANDAIFIYTDTGSATQGGLAAAFASAGGVDPVKSTTYIAGNTNTNTGFGDFTNVLGAVIGFGQIVFSRNGQVVANGGGGGAGRPFIEVDAPEQGTATHMQMRMFGTSTDGTKLSQCLIGQVAGAGALTAQTTGMLEVQGQVAAPVDSIIQVIQQAANDNSFGVRNTVDTFNRLRVAPGVATGAFKEGPGNATQDTQWGRIAANTFGLTATDLDIATAGRGLKVNEGANGKQGTATLAGGTKLVANTSVTANSRIMLTAQDNSSTGALRVSARVAGTSFTITSSNAADSGVVAFEIFEPG